MGKNKIINIVRPYIIAKTEIVGPYTGSLRHRHIIESYDEIMWDLYTTYKALNCVYIGEMANA